MRLTLLFVSAFNSSMDDVMKEQLSLSNFCVVRISDATTVDFD